MNRNDRDHVLSELLGWAFILLVVGLLGFICLYGSGCSTVHQDSVAVTDAGNYVKPVRVADGYVVDDAFRDRYNALIAVYGHKRLENGAPVFLPPLEKDFGVTPSGAGWWHFTKEAMEDMAVLSDLKRRGAAP